MQLMRKSLLAGLALLLAVPLFAQDVQNVDDILQKSFEARGGVNRLKSIQTIKMYGKVIMPAQGMEFPFVRYAKRPNNIRLEATMQGQTMTQVYDGKTAWWIFPFTGSTEPQLMPEQQAKDLIEQADFDGPLMDYKEKGNKVELLGKEDFEGTECYKLKVTLKSGDVQHYYIDPDYYLELGQKTKRERQGAETEVSSILGDYKEVDGILIPFSIDIKSGQQQSHIQIDSLQFNIDVPDSLFVMPKTEAKEPKKK